MTQNKQPIFAVHFLNNTANVQKLTRKILPEKKTTRKVFGEGWIYSSIPNRSPSSACGTKSQPFEVDSEDFQNGMRTRFRIHPKN